MGSMPCFRHLKGSLCQNTPQTLPLTLGPEVTWGRVWRMTCFPVDSGVFVPGAFKISLMGKLRLTSWTCCPLWSDGTRSSEIVPHKKLGQMDMCCFSSYPAECSENYIVSTDILGWLACFSLPFQHPLMERGRVWWLSTSPCQIEEFCGPLLSGEEMPFQVWFNLFLLSSPVAALKLCLSCCRFEALNALHSHSARMLWPSQSQGAIHQRRRPCNQCLTLSSSGYSCTKSPGSYFLLRLWNIFGLCSCGWLSSFHCRLGTPCRCEHSTLVFVLYLWS